MKTKYTIAPLAAFFALALFSALQPFSPSALSSTGFDALIPKPLTLTYAQPAARVTLTSPLRIHIPTHAQTPARVREIAELLADELASQFSLTATISLSDAIEPGAITLILQTPAVPEAIAPESYSLEVTSAGIVLAAPTPQGLLWSVQTLLQGIDKVGGASSSLTREQDAPATLPAVSITDAPARPFRGLMLDPARSFLDLDFIRRTIRVMSACKMNLLHLHLIDDLSWAYESKAFPKCNRPGDKYYTQDELRALVAYAARYGVEILPELDFPGHTHTALEAYPQLDCEGKTREVDDSVLCPGKPFTWEFIEKTVAEIAAIFPSRYIHLGGDEPFASKRWPNCPDCQARMKTKNVTTLEAYYHTFIADLDDIAKRHGKQLIVWNEAIHPGVAPMPPRDIIILVWKDLKNAQAMAAAGYTIINASATPLYLSSFGRRQGVALPAVKAWDATLFGADRPKPDATKAKYEKLPPRAMILRGEACLWATEQSLVEKRLYPRAICVAENLWSEGRSGDLADFETRWPLFQARLDRFGVSPEYKTPPEPLRPDETYSDFILNFELEADATADFTGLTVRDDYKVNVTAPPGRKFSSTPNNMKGWHACELTARGSVLTLTIDGRTAWSISNAAPRPGRITLSPAAGVKQYRNVTIRKINPKSQYPNPK